MTTASTDTPIAHTTDAEFRTWITEYETLLVTAGLVVTADTGQLTLATATRPVTVNGYAGFRIYRFNDALQSTAPIFIRIDYGTGSGSTPGIKVQVGSSTNGAGTITGVASITFIPLNNLAVISPGTVNRPSLAAHGAGYAWIVFKHGMLGSTNPMGNGWLITRTADAAGEPTALGFQIHGSQVVTAQNCSTQHMLISGPVVSAAQVPNCLIPGGYVSSVVGADVQFWKHYVATPRVRCNPYLLCTNISDIAFGVTRSLAVVGSTPRTYICVASSLGHTAGVNGTSATVLMLIWE